MNDDFTIKLDSEIDRRLKEYMQMVKSRTFDDYKKAEGLMVDSITLTDGIEIKSKD